MKKRVSLVESIMNAQTKNHLSEEQAAAFIKELVFPDEYMIQMLNLFTEIPPATFTRFQLKYGIEDRNIKEYYEAYVKPIYSCPDLEEILYVGNST